MTHQQIMATIQDWIKTGRYSAGDRLPAERELADMFEVSRTLVRSALDRLLAERWLEMPSSRIRVVSQAAPTPLWSGDSRFIGILGAPQDVVDMRADQQRVDERRVGGVTQAIGARGLSGVLLSNIELAAHLVPMLKQTRPRGLLYFNHKHFCDELVDSLLRGRIPIVTFADTCRAADLEKMPYDTVMSDHYAGGLAVVTELCRQGCRRLLYYRDEQPWQWNRERQRGILHGCELNEVTSYVEIPKIPLGCDGGDEKRFDYTCRMLSGVLMEIFKAPSRPDAVILETDRDVAYFGRALEILGLRPNRDVLLAGYDNYWRICQEQQWYAIAPAITVDKEDVKIGRLAVELLLQRVAGELPEVPQRIVQKPKMLTTSAMALCPAF